MFDCFFFPFHQHAQFCRPLFISTARPLFAQIDSSNQFFNQLFFVFFLNCSHFTHPGHWKYSNNQYFHSVFYLFAAFLHQGTVFFQRWNFALPQSDPMAALDLKSSLKRRFAETTDSKDGYRLIGVPPGASAPYAAALKVVQRGDGEPC